jgi:hypothetical protein
MKMQVFTPFSRKRPSAARASSRCAGFLQKSSPIGPNSGNGTLRTRSHRPCQFTPDESATTNAANPDASRPESKPICEKRMALPHQDRQTDQKESNHKNPIHPPPVSVFIRVHPW